jgi:hypothetical protein
VLLPRAQWQAIEADLLRAGFTLKDLGKRVTWRAVLAFVKRAPQDSAVYREMVGEDAVWTLEAQLMALAVDVLNIANFQRGSGKGTKPKPLERPGVRPKGREVYGDRSDAVSPAEFRSFWDG